MTAALVSKTLAAMQKDGEKASTTLRASDLCVAIFLPYHEFVLIHFVCLAAGGNASILSQSLIS